VGCVRSTSHFLYTTKGQQTVFPLVSSASRTLLGNYAPISRSTDRCINPVRSCCVYVGLLINVIRHIK
jgi:hypothetical protein